LLDAVRGRLAVKNIAHCHITVDWVANDWDEYRKFLGKSLIYFNPTKESPMPRSRTEACLSGCCVISTPWHDWDKYVKHGYDGLIVKKRDPDYIADLIEFLIKDYKTALSIGKRGREMAKKYFSAERYQKNWLNLINQVLAKDI